MECKLKRAFSALGMGLIAFSAVATIHRVSVRAADVSYQPVDNWAQLPSGTQWGVMTGVDVDSKDNVYTFQREQPSSEVIVFDAHGKFLKSWGENEFPGAHALRILRDGNIWITDRKLEQVLKFDLDGKLLMSIGQKGVSGANDSEDSFNGVSDVAMAENGNLFVSDGEGPNTRVVKISPDGKFIKFWGTKGADPGQFNTPHSIAIDSKGRVWVCDRGNKRLEIFDQDGKFLDQMPQFGAASSIAIKKDMVYVAATAPENRITVGTTDGHVTATIDGLNSPHEIAVDSTGAIYAAESNGKAVVKYIKK
jgi:sugar lactone lactonase YvrE